jgi:hypothetical protein
VIIVNHPFISTMHRTVESDRTVSIQIQVRSGFCVRHERVVQNRCIAFSAAMESDKLQEAAQTLLDLTPGPNSVPCDEFQLRLHILTSVTSFTPVSFIN